MRHTLRLLALLALLLPAAAFAQDGAEQVPPTKDEPQTLFGGDIDLGGFGGPLLKFTGLADEAAVLVGGRGGLLIGKSFWVGGGGMGMLNRIHVARLPGESEETTSFSYGGPMMGFVILSDRLVHAEIAALVGGGSIGFQKPSGVDEDGEPDFDTDPDAFFVFEPELNVEVNVLSFFRVGAGLAWRFMGGVDTGNWESGDFDGLAGQLILKFGSF